MNNNSKLIITTPNPWRDLWVHHIFTKNNKENWLNKEHVCWYSYQTLKQLMERYNYKEISYDYYYSENNNIEKETLINDICWAVYYPKNKLENIIGIKL